MSTLLNLGRTTVMTAAIVAASGLLEITGAPLFAAISEATRNLVAVRYEREKLRRKFGEAPPRLSLVDLNLLDAVNAKHGTTGPGPTLGLFFCFPSAGHHDVSHFTTWQRRDRHVAA
jgi:hypothetical protein